MNEIRFENLPNGLVRGFDCKSGLYGLWLKDGTPYAGSLSMFHPDAYLKHLAGKKGEGK